MSTVAALTTNERVAHADRIADMWSKGYAPFVRVDATGDRQVCFQSIAGVGAVVGYVAGLIKQKGRQR